MYVTLAISAEVLIDVDPNSPDPGQAAIDIFKEDASMYLAHGNRNSVDVVGVTP